MEIKFVRSDQLISEQWESYTRAFNFVFKQNFSQAYFINKYLNTIDRTSYHSFLLDENEITGSCSIIPFN